MIPFGLAPQLLKRGALFIKDRIKEGLSQEPDAPVRRTPFVAQEQGQQEKVQIDNRMAKRWRDQILMNQKYNYGPGYSGVVTPVDPEVGGYRIDKATKPGNKSNPSNSVISFSYLQPGAKDLNDAQFDAPQFKNPHRPGTREAIQFDYMKKLLKAGLRAGLGRQIDDIRPGSDMSASVYGGDGKGMQRVKAYERFTKGALQFGLNRNDLTAATSRRIGKDSWINLLGPGVPRGMEQAFNINRDYNLSQQFFSGRGIGQPNQNRPIGNRKADQFGVLKFDPKSLKDDLRRMASADPEIFTAVKWRGGKLPGWAQVWMEAEDMYRGMTTSKENPQGRSLSYDTFQKSKETLEPYVDQVGKNKFLPSGLQF